MYQWLLRQNGHRVSNRAYWVYANGDVESEAFSQTLQFRTTVIPHKENDSWVESQFLRQKTVFCWIWHHPRLLSVSGVNLWQSDSIPYCLAPVNLIRDLPGLSPKIANGSSNRVRTTTVFLPFHPEIHRRARWGN